ncbi:MAG: hypothetical protein PHD15_01920 [Clostridia bacterium]|nr:hypothetical protein [Clostridia bacterium]MDD4386509.1 hypothetical protein [Clostridia bacterium]
MIGTIFIITLPIAVIAFLVIAISRGVKKDGFDESFQDVIRTVYVYVIMIVFLIMFFAATVSLFNSCLEILLPDTTQKVYDSNITNTTTNRTIAEITTNITMLCISIPMFIYFSGIAKKEHNKGIDNKVKVEMKKEETIEEIKEEV